MQRTPEPLADPPLGAARKGAVDVSITIRVPADTPESVRLIQVVEVVCGRGRGQSPESAYRHVTQYWSIDGQLLAERDPMPDDLTAREGEERA